MSLLNDLQKQVKQARAKEKQQHLEQSTQQEFYNARLRPLMLRAHEYFGEIVEHLNVVEPDIQAVYPLDPLLAQGIKLRQSKYRFAADSRENPRQIDIFCRCELQKPHEFYLPGRKSAEAHAELLKSYDFPFHRKNRLDSRHDIRGATFILEGPMMVHVRVAAMPADRGIHIGFRNVGPNPLNRYRFSPEQVDEALFERTVKVLLRQLPVLIDRKLDAQTREHLRQQVELARQEQARDVAEALSERETDRQATAGGHSLRHRLREGAAALARFFSR